MRLLTGPRHVLWLARALRVGLRDAEEAKARCVGGYAEMREAQACLDARMAGVPAGWCYRSLLVPVVCTSLGELVVWVGRG